MTRLRSGWPPPQSPPIRILPPPRRPDASILALAILMCSPLTTIVPPVVPRCLPAAEIVPASLMVCAGAPAGLLPPVAASSTIMPLRAADRVGPDHASGVDDRIDHGPRGGGGELDAAAVGAERAVPAVADQRFERPAAGDVDDLGRDLVADRERDQLVAVHVEREAVAGGERHRAERGGDGPGVAHARRDQRGKAAARRRDRSPVDDRRIRPARNVEIVPPGHEVGVLDVVGGGEEARGVHHAAGAEQDAVAVDDEDAAVGGQRAHDLRRAEAAGHAVERDRRAARLVEAHALVGADVERVPVDDRAAGRLVDDHRRAALALDGGGAADHRPAFGTGRRRRQAEREKRPSCEQQLREQRLREQQIAQAWMHRGVLLQPSGEDEEEARVLARACLQQFGHGPGAQQALALRNLRNRQISGNRVQPSQP